MIQMNLFTKQVQTHIHREQTTATKVERGGGINQEFGINIYTLLYIKQINNKDLPTVQHREVYSMFLNNLQGKRMKKKYMYV